MFGPTIKLYISCHKEAKLPCGAYYRPIQVGAALAKKRFPRMLYDDTGDNISDRNRRYCELTAQYWAWKNDKADYVGFCHYRRLFSFSPKRMEADDLYGIVRERLTWRVSAEQHLNDRKRICEVLRGADVWLTDPISFVGTGLNNLYEQYGTTPELHEKDLRTGIAVLKEMYPSFSDAADTCMNGLQFSACNMFIMKWPIFDRYCAWLFPILEETEKRMDYTGYSTQGMRSIGHIAERLLSIFCTYLQQNEPDCRIGYLQHLFLGEVPLSQRSRMPIYRLTNPGTQEYFLTISEEEKEMLTCCGWKLDCVIGYASRRGTPVYRLLNPQAEKDAHCYTSSQAEIDTLVSQGWQVEGVAWFESMQK